MAEIAVMAAEMAGGALLEVVFQRLIEQLASPELRENSIALKVRQLDEKLKEARLLLADAEDRQLKEMEVKKWLDELKDVVFMAEDLIETINNSKKEKKSKRKAVVRAIKSVYHSLAKTVPGEIDLILMDLDSLLRRAIILNLKYISSSVDPNKRSSPPIAAPLREQRHTYGREAEKEDILKMLILSEEDKMIVLPIVGMGGLGKTTLAQLVYDDKRVKDHDFLKAWVTVSTEFDLCRILRELLQNVEHETSSSDLNELQRLMKEALRGKRFLFVLDDVWEENYSNWDPLKSILTSIPRSRVIITTRSRDVGYMVKTGPIHELKEVQKDHCWSIFVHHAFDGDKDVYPQLHTTGRKIVEKCKGVPLAIRCVGGLLRSERSPQKWESILNDLEHWSKVMEKGVLPSLWLSYRYLSSSLKQCFAYCSLFPQDYEFNKKTMVLLWMAEGFIQESKSMEEVGEENFDELVSRSLFQRVPDSIRLSGFTTEEKYVVHDLVHDLAAFVYGNFCLRAGDDLKNVTVRTRHLTYNKDVLSDDVATSLSTSKHLRTLMDIEPYNMSDFVKEIVLKVRCLRVVSLRLKSSVLHNSLGDLKMLRYLNLTESKIEELPDSICSMYHLQTLILFKCSRITQLPTDLPRNLSKLRHLDISDTSLRKMPPKMGSLKELRILTNFVLGKGDGSGCSTLKELGELHHLGGQLIINKLGNVDKLEDVPNAHILIDKAAIEILFLMWEGNDTGNMIDKAVDVLDALQPHKNLKSLFVFGYPASSFPKWVGETSFSKLTFVILSGGRSPLLPPLGQLPFLVKLRLEAHIEVEKIGNEFLYGNDTNSSITPFLYLEALEFHRIINWKEWSFVGNESGCFPRLRSLKISACPKLECIIREDDRAEMEYTKHFPSFCELFIGACPLLERSEKLKREEEETSQGEENSESQNV